MSPTELESLTRPLELVVQVLQRLFDHLPIDPEPDLPLPDKFSGSRTTYDHFKLDCELLFTLKPRTYATDFIKVRTATLLLTGRIKSWAHQLFQVNSPLLLTWGAFLKAMDAWMDQPQPRRSAQTAVTPQGPTPPRRANYGPATPRSVAGMDTGAMGSGVTRPQGYSGTRSVVTPRVPVPSPMETPSPVVPDPVPVAGMPEHHQVPQSVSPSVDTLDVPMDHDCTNGEEPMELGYVRARQSVQDYRREMGLCFYCGEKGHYIPWCPIRPSRVIPIGVVTTSSVTSPRSLFGRSEDPRHCPSCGRVPTSVTHEPTLATGGPTLSEIAAQPLDPNSTVSFPSLYPVLPPSNPRGVTSPVTCEPTSTTCGSTLLATAAVTQPRDPDPPDSAPSLTPGPQVGGLGAQRPGQTLKTRVAAYAATLGPGEVMLDASGLPDLRTPGLFDHDPYTEEDPCPLTRASDGTIVRSEDAETYEAALTKRSKKDKKKPKSK